MEHEPFGATVISFSLLLFLGGCVTLNSDAMNEPHNSPGPAEERQSFERSYDFHESVPRDVLDSYLSRAVTHQGLCAGFPEGATPYFDDDLRMLKSMGAKFIGRSAYAWGTPDDDNKHFRQTEERAGSVHKADPQIILQAAIFEVVDTNVATISIPAWVFEEFELKPQERGFSYAAMIYDENLFHDQWGPGASVPDMSRLETRMWFFYRAARYIDAGIEAIHFGQIHLMNANDPGYDHWKDLLARIRTYAAENARRGYVLCDSHTHGAGSPGGEGKEFELFFDFHSFPMRPKEVIAEPESAILEMNHLDSIYRRSLGGLTPGGWHTKSLPYLVEIDNFGGVVNTPGVGDIESHAVWGHDEIAWFARQPEGYRNEWLASAWNWLRRNDPNGWIQFATRRTLGGAPISIGKAEQTFKTFMYHANTRSEQMPVGFNQEETIRTIWQE